MKFLSVMFFGFAAALTFAVPAEAYSFIVSDKSVNLFHSLESAGVGLESGRVGVSGISSSPVETRVCTSRASEGSCLRSDRFSGYILIIR